MLKVSSVLVILILASFILTNLDNQTNQEPFFFDSKNRLFPSPKKEDVITPLIQSSTAKLPGKYAIYIKDLKTEESYGVNVDQKFSSASLYKLAVMYKTYDALDKDDLAENELVSADRVTLDKALEGKQNIEEGQPSTKVVSHTVENALKLMITISDNYSAILLAERLGWAKIDSLMEEKGLTEINLVGPESPNVTARAISDLLEQIYRNSAVSSKASEEMKKLLFAQKVNDRIPKYLPRDVKVGHKTGELDGIRHDAGFVLGQKSHYIFVFLSETPSPEDASENIALLAKKIYDELER